MRHEKLYLTDIVEAARAIKKFIAGADIEEFERNEMMNSAVLQKLTVIGEAASKLPKGFTKRFPEIPWKDIIGFRTIAVREYLPYAGILFGLPRQKKLRPSINKSKKYYEMNSAMNKKTPDYDASFYCATISHGYSGSVPESQDPIFLQAMGRGAPVPAALAQAKETSRSHLG